MFGILLAHEVFYSTCESLFRLGNNITNKFYIKKPQRFCTPLVGVNCTRKETDDNATQCLPGEIYRDIFIAHSTIRRNVSEA